MLSRVLWLAVAAVLSGSAVADAVVLCARQRSDGTFNSSVKIREVCRSREVQLDPAALGLQGPPGEPGVSPPGISARVFNSTDVAVPNDTGVTLTFDSERWDTADLHDPAAPGRFTIPTAGKYLVFSHLSWATQGGGSRAMGLRLNGSEAIATNNKQGDSAHHTELSVSTVWEFAVGDYVEVTVAQDSGTTVTIAANPPGLASTLEFGIARLP